MRFVVEIALDDLLKVPLMFEYLEQNFVIRLHASSINSRCTVSTIRTKFLISKTTPGKRNTDSSLSNFSTKSRSELIPTNLVKSIEALNKNN